MPEFPTPDPVDLDLRVPAGSVEIHAEPRETTTVEIAPFDDRDTSRDAAERAQVGLTGRKLVVSAPETGGWLLRGFPKLRVTVRVPAGSTARIRVASASVAGHGEWSTVTLHSASGNGYVERVTGDLTVNTASGDLQAGQLGGRLSLKTASGTVSAHQVAGAVDVKTANGGVQVDEAGTDVSVRTVAGDVRIGAIRHGAVRATTVSGDVSVGVVSGTGVWLDLNTLSGRARSDLAMDAEHPSGHDLTVQVRTVSGDIDVHRVSLPTAA